MKKIYFFSEKFFSFSEKIRHQKMPCLPEFLGILPEFLSVLPEFFETGGAAAPPAPLENTPMPVGREFHDDFFSMQPSLQRAFIEVHVSLDKTIH